MCATVRLVIAVDYALAPWTKYPGERISTQEVSHEADDKSSQWQVREQVAASIYGLMEDLFAIREKDQATWPTWRKNSLGVNSWFDKLTTNGVPKYRSP